MISLHHMGESTCSQRVRIVLAEKKLAWTSILVPPADLRLPAYLALNSAGVVPTLEHDGSVLVELRIICEYLDEAFPDEPLMPGHPVDRHKVRLWTKLFDDKLHLAVFALSFTCWMRARYLAVPTEKLASTLPGLADPVKRKISEALLKDGWDSEILRVALRQFQDLLKNMETRLGEARWLGGNHYSLADVDLLTIVQRLDDLGLGMMLDERPCVAGWLDRARGRPSFTAAFDDWRDEAVITANRARALDARQRFAGILSAL